MASEILGSARVSRAVFLARIASDGLISEIIEGTFKTNANPCNQLRKVFQALADAVIRVYDSGGNVIETHEHAGEFREP